MPVCQRNPDLSINMMKKRLNSGYPDLMVWVLGAISLITFAVLEHLAQYKAGVMRHLYYRKMKHLAGIYSSDMLFYHLGFVIVLITLAAFWGRTDTHQKRSAISLICCSCLLAGVFYFPALKDLYSYTYILFTLESILLMFGFLLILRSDGWTG